MLSYRDRQHAAAIDALYRQFVQPGDLVFDVGAHVGNRTASFLRLGAKVIAVEPQPMLYWTLRALYGWRKRVVVVPKLVAAQPGTLAMMLNVDNPTVSTASSAFVRSAQGTDGWESERWERTLRADATTLDELIERYGAPSFIKIDVEGFEAEALRGLSIRVPALSFEFTTIQRGVAAECIDLCVSLGYRRFNVALGESQHLEGWRSAETMKEWIAALPQSANSGDVYAI